MSDTPRTDAAYFKAGATMYDMAGEMKRMERELNAANQRIKQLEDARTVAAANSLANMLSYEEAVAKIKRLEGELESTKADRDSWSNQSDEFAKTAADLIIHIKRLEELGNKLRECASQLGWTSSEDPRWIGRAEAAVEAWDKEAKP